MPVVTIATVAHPAEVRLLAAVADAVAHALALGPGDVISMMVPVRAAVSSGASGGGSGGGSEPWAVITVHGSDRDADSMRRACDAASAAASDWSHDHGGALKGVWCEWLLPQLQ